MEGCEICEVGGEVRVWYIAEFAAKCPVFWNYDYVLMSLGHMFLRILRESCFISSYRSAYLLSQIPLLSSMAGSYVGSSPSYPASQYPVVLNLG